MNFKLTITRPAKLPTVDEELLKLDLLEVCKTPKTVFSLYDEVLIAIGKRSMQHSHKAFIPEGSDCVLVIRKNCDTDILKIVPTKSA